MINYLVSHCQYSLIGHLISMQKIFLGFQVIKIILMSVLLFLCFYPEKLSFHKKFIQNILDYTLSCDSDPIVQRSAIETTQKLMKEGYLQPNLSKSSKKIMIDYLQGQYKEKDVFATLIESLQIPLETLR